MNPELPLISSITILATAWAVLQIHLRHVEADPRVRRRRHITTTTMLLLDLISIDDIFYRCIFNGYLRKFFKVLNKLLAIGHSSDGLNILQPIMAWIGKAYPGQQLHSTFMLG